ncbi:cobalamin B12-binding domain-containing protein [Amycolatopsis magusensis]|uniref:cobalamin B12-binding domain-containing protein n=1 Tax=Amycolatopsis magusensis TaxID=882444 RepID=UPI0037A47D17
MPQPPLPVPSALHVLVTSVQSDAHTWNLVFLQLTVEELGHRVTNLGPCVPEALLAAECVRLRPDLVVVSSVNGHGFADGLRLIAGLRSRAELAGLPVVIGGKLGVNGEEGAQERGAALVEAGFDAVFGEETVHLAGSGALPAADGSRLFRSYLAALPAGLPC